MWSFSYIGFSYLKHPGQCSRLFFTCFLLFNNFPFFRFFVYILFVFAYFNTAFYNLVNGEKAQISSTLWVLKNTINYSILSRNFKRANIIYFENNTKAGLRF